MPQSTDAIDRYSVAAILVAVVAVSSACSAPQGESFTVTDSAGITIVESFVPQWANGAGWTIDATPMLDLSTTGTGPDHEFFRVVDGMRLADGTIVIADFGSRQVRRYSVDGRSVQTTGRQGDGPGEFQRMRSLEPYRGDSIVVYDFWLGRLTILGPSLDLGRMVTLGRPDVRVFDVLPLADGRLLAVVGAIGVPEGTSGIHRSPYSLILYSPVGDMADTVATLPGPEGFVGAQFDAGPLLAKTGHVAVRGDRMYLGAAERMEVEVRVADGRLDRIIRVPGYDLSLSTGEIRDERLARTPANAPARIVDIIASMPDPASRPAYKKLLVSPDGHVWAAEENGFAGRDAPTDWEVFAPSGAWLGPVRVPAGFTALQFGEDFVLGVWRDDLDVEHVQLLPLARN